MNMLRSAMLLVLCAGCTRANNEQDESRDETAPIAAREAAPASEEAKVVGQEVDDPINASTDEGNTTNRAAELSPEVAAAIAELVKSVESVGSYEYVGFIRYEGIDGFGRAMDSVRNLKAEEASVPALVDALENGKNGVPQKAAYVLGRFGAQAKAALPALVRALDADDPHLRVQAAGALWRVDRRGDLVVQLLIDVVEDERDSMYHAPNRVLATRYLGEMGAAAKQAVPVLANVVKETPIVRGDQADNRPIQAAREALRKIEPEREALALGELLKSSKRGGDLGAANGLAELGAAALPALPQLIDALKDTNPGVRSVAALTLGKIGPPAAEAVPRLIEMIDDKNYTSVRVAAVIALGGIRARADLAVPALTKASQHPYEGVRSRAKEALANFQLQEADPPDDSNDELPPEIAATVLELLRATGEFQDSYGPFTDPVGEAIDRLRELDGVEQALPEIVRAIQEHPKKLRGFIAFTVIFAYLRAEAKSVVPQLIEIFKKGRRNTRQTVAGIFGAIGPDAQSAAPVLLEALASDNEQMQLAAARALTKIGAGSERVVATLIELLNSDEERWHYSAAEILSEHKAEAARVAPVVVETFRATRVAPASVEAYRERDTDQEGAVRVLARFGVAAVPPLINLLLSDKAEERKLAAKCLARIESDAKSAIPCLSAALDDSDATVRIHAAEAILYVGGQPDAAISTLTDMLNAADAEVSAQAAGALRRIGPGAEAAIPSLIEGLRRDLSPVFGGNTSTRNQVFESALSAMGKVAVPYLRDALRHEDARIRLGAVWALESIGPEAQEASQALAVSLQDEKSEIRWGAAWALYEIRPKSKEIIPALLESLKDKDEYVCYWSCLVLGEIGADPKVAVPALIEAFRGGNRGPTGRRLGAVQALTEFGPAAAEAVPLLIGALNDPAIREAAVTALAAIGPPAKEAVPALKQLLEYKWSLLGDVRNVRSAARTALKKIQQREGARAP